MTKPARTPLPKINLAPLGELNAYIVYEHELDEIARGSPVALYLNFAIALIGIGASFLIALLTTSFTENLVRSVVFCIICVATLILGVLYGILWYRDHTSTGDVIERIKRRMPLDESTQADPGGATAIE